MHLKMSEKRVPELIGMGEVGTDRHERLQRVISEMKQFGIDCEWISVPDFIESRRLNDLEVVGQDGFETSGSSQESKHAVQM